MDVYHVRVTRITRDAFEFQVTADSERDAADRGRRRVSSAPFPPGKYSHDVKHIVTFVRAAEECESRK